MNDENVKGCSFCGRSKEDTLLLISGNISGNDDSYICDKCIKHANKLLEEEVFGTCFLCTIYLMRGILLY